MENDHSFYLTIGLHNALAVKIAATIWVESFMMSKKNER
jgi:hypothetical protein